jgi:CubicO group peptidase (beta-lactamase class C family)
MRTPLPKFDHSGTFVGSSYLLASPQDFARFGYLYLRDGVWDGRRILPEGWVDYARTPDTQRN